VGCVLDMELRARTKNAKSLDDLMRLLLERHGKPGAGVPETANAKAIAELGGDEMSALLTKITSRPRTSWISPRTWREPVWSFARAPARASTDKGGSGGKKAKAAKKKEPDDDAPPPPVAGHRREIGTRPQHRHARPYRIARRRRGLYAGDD